ncbi:MAG: sigma-70 family RNA polymerase sigma factor [Clostridiales bacterium]|nr:sigma-70 family RNA polymerase sigma factor [Clostridiales bacterium]
MNKEEQLSEMIDTYQNLVFSICYKVTADYFAAEDLTQEAFLAAYKNLDSFEGTNEKAWLCRIATNKSIDYLRSAGRRVVPTEDIFFEQQSETRSSPEEMCLEKEVRERLLEYCSKLKSPYDEIAKAVYYDEMKAEEIARRRNENIKTVQTQIYRARDMLRKLYGKERSA